MPNEEYNDIDELKDEEEIEEEISDPYPNAPDQFKQILNMDPEDNTNIIQTNLLAGYRSNCAICTHAGAYESSLVYFNTGRDLAAVRNFFIQKFGREFDTKRLENHFKTHVDPYVDQITVTRQQRIEILKKRMRQKERTANKVAMIKEIIWDFVEDLWLYKPDQLINSEDFIKHKTLSKQLSELGKLYKEYYAMELEMLGQGKSEDELRSQMENYMKSYVKKILHLLENDPGAYRKVAEYFGLSIDLKSGSEDQGINDNESDEENE